MCVHLEKGEGEGGADNQPEDQERPKQCMQGEEELLGVLSKHVNIAMHNGLTGSFF